MLSVILAAGRGTRLQSPSTTSLSREQELAAASGLKAAFPLHDRPFLDYVLSSLADAGFGEASIIVRPDDTVLRDRYSKLTASRVDIHFVVQQEPRGTAHALLTAEPMIGARPFVVLNADNYYPVSGLLALRNATEPATLAFSRAGLLANG